MARTIREQERANAQTREADRAELQIAELTIIEQRQLLRSLEAQNATLRKQLSEMERATTRVRVDDLRSREPEPDLSEAYKLGDMLRPNPGGSVTLLRDTGTILRFRAITTWEPNELSAEVRRLVEDDHPRIVSRRRDVSFADAMKAMEMPQTGSGT